MVKQTASEILAQTNMLQIKIAGELKIFLTIIVSCLHMTKPHWMTGMIGLKGLCAGVIGGFGYLPGAIVGGMVLGIVENLASMILPSMYKDCI